MILQVDLTQKEEIQKELNARRLHVVDGNAMTWAAFQAMLEERIKAEGAVRFREHLLTEEEALAKYGTKGRNGAMEYTSLNSKSPAAVRAPSLPRQLQVYPNPGGDQVSVRFELPQAGPVRVTASDMKGQVVAVWFDGPMKEGSHQLNPSLKELAAGVYQVHVSTSTGEVSQRLVVQ